MVSRLTPAYAAPSATVNQVFMVPPCARTWRVKTNVDGWLFTRRGTPAMWPAGCETVGADAGDGARIKPSGQMGARGVEAISAIPFVHSQPAAASRMPLEA